MFGNGRLCHFAFATLLAAQGAALGENPGPVPGAPMPSSFPGPLWEVVTPVGGTVSVANAHLILNVPGGSNHDPLRPWNQAVRVLQRIGNYDFDISIKIDSPIDATAEGTSEGLMVLADDEDFLIFALTTDGSSVSLSART
ncbi:MAG TPA: hypothetical protein VMB49_21690, partial [Acidobacteriaceae bacterium]|nr:hypothetical protein [Acidobacteriaceae bacterium]